jgi:hypothetical protein
MGKKINRKNVVEMTIFNWPDHKLELKSRLRRTIVLRLNRKYLGIWLQADTMVGHVVILCG